MKVKEEKLIRNYNVDILRFVFCFLIINYHLFSHYLIDTDFPHFFTRSYLGDEYFFIISGFYLSKAAQKQDGNYLAWGVQKTVQRLKKVAIPYYITWFFCFWGVRFTKAYEGVANKSVFEDAANSIYELFFIEMFGFKKGLYSNDVAWFFSALLIVTFILAPWMAKYKKGFSLYFAPLIVLFSYGILSMHYDWLYAPYYFIGDSVIMKGLIRALAAICIGVALNGVLESEKYKLFMERLRSGTRNIICFTDIILWLIVLIYMVYPFRLRLYETKIQYDYIIVLLMTIAMIPVLGGIWSEKHSERYGLFARKLGKCAFYAFFGQAIFYSFDKIIYSYDMNIYIKVLILYISVSFFSYGLYVLAKKTKKYINKHC